MWETWVWSLGWEDLLEKGKATLVLWPGEFHGLYSIVHRVTKRRTWLSNFHFHVNYCFFSASRSPSGFPSCLGGKESTCQSRRHGFSPWVRKSTWRRKWLPTLVFLPGRSHGQRGTWLTTGHEVSKESDMTWWLNNNSRSPFSKQCGTPPEVLASIFKSCVSVECFQIIESFPIQFYILDSWTILSESNPT